jgi:glucose/arabinose dehydrogenase
VHYARGFAYIIERSVYYNAKKVYRSTKIFQLPLLKKPPIMKGVRSCFSFFSLIVLFTACHTAAKNIPVKNDQPIATDSINVKLQLLTSAIKAPVELAVPNDSLHRMFITDNAGNIWILKNDSVWATPFLRMTEKFGKQDKTSLVGRIFSVAFHPQFSTNGKFYVCYDAPSLINKNISKLVVSQFNTSKTNPDVTDLVSEQRMIEVEGKGVGSNGAQISFGPDGYLYISVGDDKGGDSTYKFLAQDLSVLRGKLLRIDVNKMPYSIPADNPFINIKNVRPEIWAYGFRKLWRYSFDPVTHEIFGGDVGEDRVEEIDIVKKGGNYGWPVMEGDSSFQNTPFYNKAAYIAPINTYTHKTGICVIGGSFYNGQNIPALENKYVFGDFNGSLFALGKNQEGKWIRQPLKISNRPADPFLLCGCDRDDKNELVVMGMLNGKAGYTGAIYKVEKN